MGVARSGAFFRVILPLAAPGSGGDGYVRVSRCLEGYLFALALTTDDSIEVITVTLTNMFSEDRVAWNEIMAAAIIVSPFRR